MMIAQNPACASVELTTCTKGGASGVPNPVGGGGLTQQMAVLRGSILETVDLDGLALLVAQLQRVRDDATAATDASDADVAYARGVLTDFATAQELVLGQTVQAMSDADLQVPHRVGKRLRMRHWGRVYDAALEVSNLALDIVFLVRELWAHSLALFVASAVCLALSLLLRLGAGLQERAHVDWGDSGKGKLYAYGLLLSLIEPFWGGRLIKRSFKRSAKSGGQVWSAAAGRMVNDDRDPLAVQAGNDAVATRAEVTTSLVLVLAEDVPGFVIQVLFLALTESSFTLRDPILCLTLVTTLLHAWRQLSEAWQLSRDLPHLRCQALARHKVFAETATDGGVVAFAKAAGAEYARTVGLRRCADITDAAVVALAARCPNITSVHLDRCCNITDTALVALAEGCPGIAAIWLRGCSNITDAAVVALAERCRGIADIRLGGCTNITDTALLALAGRCPGIVRIVLDNRAGSSNITDVGVVALAERCPGIADIVLAGANITDEAVGALAKRCPGITAIALGGCSNLTDEAVKELARHCPKLNSVNFEYCENLTNEALSALRLKGVNVTT
jgi:hypothetical protein